MGRQSQGSDQLKCASSCLVCSFNFINCICLMVCSIVMQISEVGMHRWCAQLSCKFLRLECTVAVVLHALKQFQKHGDISCSLSKSLVHNCCSATCAHIIISATIAEINKVVFTELVAFCTHRSLLC